MTQLPTSPNPLSETAGSLTQRSLSGEEPASATSSQNNLSSFIQDLAYCSGYFFQVYGCSKRPHSWENYKKIAQQANGATNCLTKLWSLADTFSPSKFDAIHKEILSNHPVARNSLCKGIHLNRHPSKSSPLWLATSLCSQLAKLEIYIEHLSLPQADELAKDALHHLLTLTDELNVLRIKTGWMPRWPNRWQLPKTIET